MNEFTLYEGNEFTVSPKTDPTTFWKIHGAKLPQLSSIALDIISVPVTEVTSERLFSHLNIVFNKLRAKLDTDVLNDILFLRWNQKFLK